MMLNNSMNRPPLFDEASAMVGEIKAQLGKKWKIREWVGASRNLNGEMTLQIDVYVLPESTNLQKETFKVTNGLHGHLGEKFMVFGPKTEYMMDQSDNNVTEWRPVLIYRLVLKERYPWNRGMTPNFKIYI